MASIVFILYMSEDFYSLRERSFEPTSFGKDAHCKAKSDQPKTYHGFVSAPVSRKQGCRSMKSDAYQHSICTTMLGERYRADKTDGH